MQQQKGHPQTFTKILITNKILAVRQFRAICEEKGYQAIFFDFGAKNWNLLKRNVNVYFKNKFFVLAFLS